MEARSNYKETLQISKKKIFKIWVKLFVYE